VFLYALILMLVVIFCRITGSFVMGKVFAFTLRTIPHKEVQTGAGYMVAEPDVSQNESTNMHPNFAEINCGVLYIANDLRMCVVNELAGRLLNAEGVIGRFVNMRDYLDSSREEYQILASMIGAHREYRDTILTWEIGGRIRHVLMDSYTHRSDNGQFLGMHVMMKDLGNFSALEQQMQRTDKLATVGKIAAGIAHEIRNPLTTIKGFLQILQGRFENGGRVDELQFTEVMLREIERVNDLVSELLLLSKPHKVSMQPCSIRDVILDICPLIQSEALLQNVQFEYKIEQDATVYADKAMLKQVVLNLTKNSLEALDHSGHLGICVTVHGNLAQIDVSDTGPGIPYYQLDRIFDAFYTTKEKGTGLGLPICQRIIAEHGGEIRVSSKGYGCTFTVLLPIYNEVD
jgi:two-component system, sporulation sensor kinase E